MNKQRIVLEIIALTAVNDNSQNELYIFGMIAYNDSKGEIWNYCIQWQQRGDFTFRYA